MIDPTGAGDSSRAASWATSRRIRDAELDHELLCRAMAYGTALASFNVEEFGVERVARLGAREIAERVAELARITRFSDSRSSCAAATAGRA